MIHTPTRRGIRKALESLPEGAEDTYTEAWQRICAQRSYQAELGKKTLLWLTYATRPLRTQELQHALAIEDDDDGVDSEGLVDVQILTSFSAGLVVIDKQSNLKSLVHPTAQEYFQRRKKDLFPAGHEDIAKICITYLMMKNFRNCGPCDEEQAFYERWSSHPLLGYAAVNWGHHAKQAACENTFRFASAFLDVATARDSAKQALVLNTAGTEQWGPEWPDSEGFEWYSVLSDKEFRSSHASIGAMHLAALFGLNAVVESLLKTTGNINMADGIQATALHWALIGQHNDTVKLLLNFSKMGISTRLDHGSHVSYRYWQCRGY